MLELLSLEYVEHPLIKPRTVERRKYQEDLARMCLDENMLIVLPTGLGKTVIALLAIAEHLRSYPDKKCVVLAPTRPLTHQHHRFLLEHLALEEGDVGVVTGEDQISSREVEWRKRVVCATPQVTRSDMDKGFVKLDEVCLMVFDEAHRAVGNHPYCILGSTYASINPQGRMIGFTASLPSGEGRVKEIMRSLMIHRVEVRDDRSEDVKPYIKKTDVEWVELTLSPILSKVRGELKSALASRLKKLQDSNIVEADRWGGIGLKTLLDLRGRVQQTRSIELKTSLFSSIRLIHALNLIETQSVSSLVKFLDRLFTGRRGSASKDIQEDAHVKEAYETARGALVLGVEHPKMEELRKVLASLKKGEKAIVFTSYRDSVESICRSLSSAGLRVNHLIGKSGEGGQSQAKQIQTLEDLKNGVFDILVATQVGEEGLDVAECNTVVFYDNVPSAVRFVQRRGRTGRRSPGRVVVFLTKGTRDEAYYWMGRRKMKETEKVIGSMKKGQKGPLDSYVEVKDGSKEPLVYVDSRETDRLINLLKERGARVEVQSLDVGDFVVSGEVIVERKTVEDFARSIMDGRLFKQMVAMKETYSKPILILQGDRREGTGVGDASFFGALASIVSDFQIPVFTSDNDRETTEIVYHIARREQMEKKREVRVREGKRVTTLPEGQKYVVAGLPGVNTVLADRLLKKLNTVENVFSASEEELREVEGIGEKLAKKIRELSSTPYATEA